MVVPDSQPAKSKTRSFNCPSCGGQLEIRAPQHCVVVGCQHCGSLLDPSHADVRLLERYQEKTRLKPWIPLGRRGTLRGQQYEMLGMLRRKVMIEGTAYRWDEYLLWNPYHGHRWLTLYDGHFVFVKPCTGAPEKKGLEYLYQDRLFKRFQFAEAETTYVLGEFYWEVRKGDRVACADFVAPPYLLSRERTKQEESWSLGEYLPGAEVWKGFDLPGNPPPAIGVAPAQPSPWAAPSKAMGWTFLLALALTLLVQLGAVSLSRGALVHQQAFECLKEDQEKSRVSESFTLSGRRSNVLVDFSTNLQNQWAWFDCALIEENTGEAVNFSGELEYYYGIEGGETWREGNTLGELLVPSVPAGRYYLRIEPETSATNLQYTVRVHRDVPLWRAFFIAAAPIILPYLWFLWRRSAFEHRRWLESDLPLKHSSSDD